MGVTMTVLVTVVGEGVTMTVLIMVVGEGVTVMVVVVVVVTVLIPTEGVKIVDLVSMMPALEGKEIHMSMRLITSTSGLDMMWTTPDAVGISCSVMPLSSPRVIKPSLIDTLIVVQS